MASLPHATLKPRSHISTKSSPPALREALLHIFSMAAEGLWLVGGTAIAGYYAEHRRSDDLDLFAIHPEAFHAAVLAVKSLKGKGALLKRERSSPLYYHADALLQDHPFTIDVVLDENLGSIGYAKKTDDGVTVADFETLLTMKAACLVSRCSEKDLFDLDWMLKQIPGWSIADLIALGSKIDGGLSVETLLISLRGSVLRKTACSFLLPTSPFNEETAYKKIVGLQKRLVERLLSYENKLPPTLETSALAQSLKQQRELVRRKPKAKK